MNKKNFGSFVILILTIISLVIVSNSQTTYATQESNNEGYVRLTRDEQQYVINNPIIHVTYLDGSAPIAYTENGEMKGIIRGILDEIAERTGFVFVYREVHSGSELIEGIESREDDIIGAAPVQYSEELKEFVRSETLLKSETVLFMRAGIDTSNLSNYVFGTIEGGEIPKGVKKSNVEFYKNREAVLNAVEKGKADYCYSNIFSIAYYTSKYGYSNVVSIPASMEARDYFLIYRNGDEKFISVMNKAMASIPDEELSNIILQSTSQVEQKLSVKALLQKYMQEVVFLVLAVIIGLALILFMLYKKGIQYKRQNKQYLFLAGLSDEYMYEYDFKRDRLTLSDDVSSLLGLPKRIKAFTKSDFFKKHGELEEIVNTEKCRIEIDLQMYNGEKRTFRIVRSVICDNNNNPYRITGKIIDVSEEKQKLQELNKKAERDALTGLYNSGTTRNLIEKALYESPDTTSALFMIDIDRFKEVNDTYGHPIGDAILSNMATDIKELYRKEDIVGRIGGDEFCAFINTDINENIVIDKCQQLIDINTKQMFKEYGMPTLSIGVVLKKDNHADFHQLYKAADAALYKAKRNGRNSYVLDIME
ncbi:MAG: GGDEF domain-containing protein [Eubacteriales bacterium]|nr:GGDEF domain-containing protein [Eubacteriales bacterium]MDD4389997.1 GGDEF domain-containing protein [Eubacteriales bacterium]